jgi:hypothetical protein
VLSKGGHRSQDQRALYDDKHLDAIIRGAGISGGGLTAAAPPPRPRPAPAAPAPAAPAYDQVSPPPPPRLTSGLRLGVPPLSLVRAVPTVEVTGDFSPKSARGYAMEEDVSEMVDLAPHARESRLLSVDLRASLICFSLSLPPVSQQQHHRRVPQRHLRHRPLVVPL